MGTSSLYKGPKGSILLPSDYDNGGDTDSVATQPEDGQKVSTEEQIDNIPSQEPTDEQLADSIPSIRPITWKVAKNAISKSAGSSNESVKSAIRTYTKVLGGHKKAAFQAKTARRVTSQMINLLSGSAEQIRRKIQDAGILVNNRPTSEIFNDICSLLAPVPNSLEDAVVNDSVVETVSEITLNVDFDPSSLDIFNEALLQKMIIGFVKKYIYNKLERDCTFGLLKKCETVQEIQRAENKIKEFIDGVVEGVLPSYFEEGINPTEVDMVVKDMYDACYKGLEELV